MLSITVPVSFLAPARRTFVLAAFALPLGAIHAAGEKLELPAEPMSVDDDRAGIQQLYQSFGRLLDKGWTLDIVARSQPEGTGHAIPIVALRTAVSGPAIWIISGIHGEEPAGPNAIANVVDVIAEAGQQRPMVLIPLANPHGYVRNWRYLNSPVWSDNTDAQSVGDSSHMLIDPEKPAQPRAAIASSTEADALTRYISDFAPEYPPLMSIDLHEDNKISEGYVYSQGENGAGEPLAAAAVQVLRENAIPIKMHGETRFGERIQQGIIGPVIDSSIDELMSAREIIVTGASRAGPGAPVVLVFETPAGDLPLAQRISAHEALLRRMLRLYLDAED